MYCRVCGLKQEYAPWGEDENNPSFNICDCCGVEFGYEDRLKKSIQEYRTNWLNNGAKWHNLKEKPENWNLEEQLKQIPQKYK